MKAEFSSLWGTMKLSVRLKDMDTVDLQRMLEGLIRELFDSDRIQPKEEYEEFRRSMVTMLETFGRP